MRNRLRRHEPKKMQRNMVPAWYLLLISLKVNRFQSGFRCSQSRKRSNTRFITSNSQFVGILYFSKVDLQKKSVFFRALVSWLWINADGDDGKMWIRIVYGVKLYANSIFAIRFYFGGREIIKLSGFSSPLFSTNEVLSLTKFCRMTVLN